MQRIPRLPRDERRQIIGGGLSRQIARQLAELRGGRLRAEETATGARVIERPPVVGPGTPCAEPEHP